MNGGGDSKPPLHAAGRAAPAEKSIKSAAKPFFFCAFSFVWIKRLGQEKRHICPASPGGVEDVFSSPIPTSSSLHRGTLSPISFSFPISFSHYLLFLLSLHQFFFSFSVSFSLSHSLSLSLRSFSLSISLYVSFSLYPFPSLSLTDSHSDSLSFSLSLAFSFAFAHHDGRVVEPPE